MPVVMRAEQANSVIKRKNRPTERERLLRGVVKDLKANGAAYIKSPTLKQHLIDTFKNDDKYKLEFIKEGSMIYVRCNRVYKKG